MKIRTTHLLVLLPLFSAATACAQLKWEQSEIELRPAIGDATAVAHFKYENAGQKPIKITAVQTSCGCTAAKPDKDVVDPGEKGEITATFNIGDRTGVQTKMVNVETDDPQQQRYTLTLRTVIPAVLELTPTFVFWRPDEPMEPKVITAKVGADVPITDVKVESSDPAITATVAKGENDKEFRITVTPQENKQQHSAQLTIRPNYPTGAPKTYYASARVLPAGTH